MRIAVIGAGALGGTFATLLERAGHQVTVTARGAGLAAITADGIRLTGEYGEAHGHPLVVEALTETPELALVCTKAQDAAAAIEANADMLGGAPVIVVQNGLAGVATAEALLPGSDCFGALVIIAANYTEPGVVRVTTAAPTYIGRGTGPADAASRHWASVLSAAVPTVAISNFVGAQWTKLIVNMLNGIPAITGMSVQDVVDNRELRRVMTASMREAVRVGMANGVHFGSIQSLSDRSLRVFSHSPLWAGQIVPFLMRRRMGNVPNLGSTQQSLRRGQLTEIDFLNGAVVQEATRAGMQAPVNALITTMVHEVEQAGASLSAAEVVRRFEAL